MKLVTFLPYMATIYLPATTTVIAIGSQNSLYSYEHEFTHKLDLEFNDGYFIKGVSFNEEMANQLLDFLDDAPDDQLVVVHCGQGVIRSPAVAVFMADFLDYKLELDFEGCLQHTHFMNDKIYQVLSKAYYNRLERKEAVNG